MITFKELSEAHKVGDKVTIVKGPKDVKGKEGRIGEIRKQAYKGAPKTYTVDYDHHETTGERKSVQLQAKHIKGMKEEVENLQEKHRVAITLSDPNHPAVTKRKELIQKTVRVKADNPGHAVDSAIHHFRKAGYKVHDHNYIGTVKEDTQLDELSTDKLAAYKTKAHADAKAADASGNYAKGDKRFKGINKATNKQFDNDLKKHGQYVKEDHLVHVSDGSKYGDKPSKKDTEHVMAGVKAHKGEYDGASDKGAFFKFKTHSDADNFKRHVDKCPGKTCYADHSEEIEYNLPSLDEARREDDEYHVPDPVKHTYQYTVSKPGVNNGEKHSRTVTTGSTTRKKHEIEHIARAHLEKQGYKIHESVELEEGTFKYHMDKAVAAHDRGDTKRKAFHLDNAKQARYSLKSTEIAKHKDLLDKYKSMNEDADLKEARGLADKYYKMAQDRKETAHENKGNHEVYHTHMADHHDAMSRYHEELGQHSLAQAHADKADIHHEKSMQKNEAVDLRAQLQKHSDAAIAANKVGDDEKVKHHMNKMNAIKDKMAKSVTEDAQLEENWIVHKDGKIIKKFKTHDGAKAHAEKHGAEVNSSEYYHDNLHKKLGEEAPVNNIGGGNIAGTQGDAGKKTVMTKKPMKRNVMQFKEYAIDAKGHKSSTGGLTQKGVDAYNRKTGGNLQTAVTTPPSKLDPDSKAAKRRKSFCARMGGMPGPMKDEKGRPTRKALALRKWNC